MPEWASTGYARGRSINSSLSAGSDSNIMLRLLVISLLLLPSLSTADPFFPAPYTAHYTVKKGALTLGTMQRTLSLAKDGMWTLESVTRPTGLAALFIKDEITERSSWFYQDQQIKPQRYRYHNSKGKQERELDLVFDASSNIVKNNVADHTWELTLPPLVYDKLNYQIALMIDLQQGKTKLDYLLVDKEKIKEYRFMIAGDEQLATPLGLLSTVKITRIQDSDERMTTVWCAPSLGYVPVKIEQFEQDAGEFSMMIESLQGLPLP